MHSCTWILLFDMSGVGKQDFSAEKLSFLEADDSQGGELLAVYRVLLLFSRFSSSTLRWDYDCAHSLTLPASRRLVWFRSLPNSRPKKGKSRVAKDRVLHDRVGATLEEHASGDSNTKPSMRRSRWRHEKCPQLEIVARGSRLQCKRVRRRALPTYVHSFESLDRELRLV